ncbi:uncharacterized protein LOC127856565 [Dreissena polymorpha]|uniref:Uncharacterized protein n=1 Tax=Dreissena polymorpha TaxID=45954 RepID=A0A9D4HFJ0_DREPO|nr:uncharacterized protein LOC127856565 [Dreissena polymorpha]KAH3715803.1 hypothetical protein DPMN_058516 [Dreissena polymorpha]
MEELSDMEKTNKPTRFDSVTVHKEKPIGKKSVLRFRFKDFTESDTATADVAIIKNTLTVTATHGEVSRLEEYTGLKIEEKTAVKKGKKDYFDVTVIKTADFNLQEWLDKHYASQ